MKKVLFIEKSELVELFEENFGVKVDVDVTEEVEEEVEVTKDIIELYVDGDYEETLDKVLDELDLSESEVKMCKKNKQNVIIIDFMDIIKLLENSYDVTLTGRYEPTTCELFENDVFAFEIN